MNNDIKNIENIWKILHSYEAEVFGYIKHSVGSADIAKDIYQDVYLQALQNIHELDIDRSLKNWLMTVARNKVINYYREKKRREYVIIQDDSRQTEMELNTDFEKQIRQALIQLPESQKEVFIARELDGLSYEELAIKIGLSISAVTSLLDRARKNFAKAILINMMPDSFKKNVNRLTLEDLVRFVDSFDSLDTLLSRMEKRSQKYFANISESWDEMRKRFIDNKRLNEILKILGEQQGKQTMDLGSGTGFISLHCALNGSTVYAIDLNKKMLKRQMESRVKLSLQILNLVQADINYQLPFINGQFDQVFLTLVLHHINDPLTMLQRTTKMIKAGGRLILIDFVRHNDQSFADEMHDLWLGFEPAKIQKWLKKSGLQIINSLNWQTDQKIKVFCQIYIK
jgi:RNA polymerase sigma factor (sigma-70 family)